MLETGAVCRALPMVSAERSAGRAGAHVPAGLSSLRVGVAEVEGGGRRTVRSCAWSTGRLFTAESNSGTWLSDGTLRG